ncbi:flavodoxin family protein [Clostridium sp. YIM B02505]|uniref:Flavodoxin family protein n=1 Tax=Clostridium yunnanense TaxID=2800325 RepID=A0ABS1EJD2_9CLOT|nr:flavodoxin family protein [Clostridium yunnanense]MBK1809465.1 flavodoxin family protein [Clostridium yunnanense]
MKVFGIIGSMNGINSREYQIIAKYFSAEKYKNADVKIITADQLNIKYCRGCCTCFNTGVCPLDSTDDMESIKKYLLEADLIIVSSPVYMHQVSGFMKNVLDRIAYWTHTFHLIGKRIVVCTSTSSSGSEYVISYLKKVMSALGGIVLGEIIVDDMTTIEEIEEKCKYINNMVSQSSVSLANISVSTFQHTLYKGLRSNLIEKEGYEHDYWLENNMFDYFTFKEYLLYRLNLYK